MKRSGVDPRHIYDTVLTEEQKKMPFETFKRRLYDWQYRNYPEDETLKAGTYNGFVAHDATVQVNSEGKIIQAWVKQTADENQFELLLDAIKASTEPVYIEPIDGVGEGMLEIPLVDMHFPISEHRETANELLGIIVRTKWEEINIVIGQDLFHNDDLRGRTASGRPIEKVDIPKAWNMARSFWINVINQSLKHAEKVNLIYSVGNHDESLAWAFVQMLKEKYPQVSVDDRIKQRKIIHWKDCFIGVTHGHYTKSTKNDLRGQFTIEFPVEFSQSKVREIHAGHLHREDALDVYGVMIRRLSRNGETDEWSDGEGFIGAHKRFMLFEWLPGRLKSIHYV